jgi:hypothetical protein
MIPIDRAAGSINETLNAGISGSDEHVDEPSDVGGMGVNRVGQGARNGAESRLVEDEVHTGSDPITGLQVSGVAPNVKVVLPSGRAEKSADFGEITLGAGGEVIEPDDALVEAEQSLQKV